MEASWWVSGVKAFNQAAQKPKTERSFPLPLGAHSSRFSTKAWGEKERNNGNKYAALYISVYRRCLGIYPREASRNALDARACQALGEKGGNIFRFQGACVGALSEVISLRHLDSLLAREWTVLVLFVEHGHKVRGRTQFIQTTLSYPGKCY